MAHVQTVLGRIDPADLGFTLPHEHTQIALWHVPDRWDYWQLTRDEPLIPRSAEVGALAQASSAASTLSATFPLRAWLMGQPSLATSAAATKSSFDIPGTTPRTVR